MALPSAYTETELATYMHAILGPVAATLGWSVAAGSYDEAINETLGAYGVDDIADVATRANIVKLRTLARREVWRAVVQATASHYDVNADGSSRHRSQIQAQALVALERAEIDALPYDAAYTVGVHPVHYGRYGDERDPYEPPDDEATT